MFPIPATKRWSISSALRRVRRPASRRARSAAPIGSAIGSNPRCASSGSSAVVANICPNVRGSTKRRSSPPEKPRVTCVCGSRRLSAGARSIWPLIPMWATTTSPPSRCNSRYFPLRPAATRRLPTATSASRLGGWRRTERAPVTSALSTSLPTKTASTPRRIVSTSASSGKSGPPALQLLPKRLPRLLGGRLFRLLLGPSSSGPVWPSEDVHGRFELLGGVRPLVAQGVARQLVEVASGELLKAGLVILASGSGGSFLDPRAEQAHDDLVRGQPSPVEIDGPDQRLGGVGEDGGLLPSPGKIFSFAEEQRAADVESGGHLGERCGVHHRRPYLGQLALGYRRVGSVQVVSDNQPEDGVAKELEAFVGVPSRMLSAPGAVAQRLDQQALVDHLPAYSTGQLPPGLRALGLVATRPAGPLPGPVHSGRPPQGSSLAMT